MADTLAVFDFYSSWTRSYIFYSCDGKEPDSKHMHSKSQAHSWKKYEHVQKTNTIRRGKNRSLRCHEAEFQPRELDMLGLKTAQRIFLENVASIVLWCCTYTLTIMNQFHVHKVSNGSICHPHDSCNGREWARILIFRSVVFAINHVARNSWS